MCRQVAWADEKREGARSQLMMDADESTFSVLFERHRRELRAHCYRMVGSFEDSEDLVQDDVRARLAGTGAVQARGAVVVSRLAVSHRDERLPGPRGTARPAGAAG